MLKKLKGDGVLQKCRYYLIYFFLLFMLYELCMKWIEPKLLPISHIKIKATYEHIDKNMLKKRISPYVRGFFSTNVVALKREIISVPFIDEVFVKREWPDTLIVSLTEITLIASWGENAAVTSQGQILHVESDENQRLPRFVGPEGQVKNMSAQFKELSQLLLPYNMHIKELNLNLRHSWQITLDDGVKLILGRNSIYEHLAAFISIYPKIKKQQGGNIEFIDLRYSNGVSVQLKTEKND